METWGLLCYSSGDLAAQPRGFRAHTELPTVESRGPRKREPGPRTSARSRSRAPRASCSAVAPGGKTVTRRLLRLNARNSLFLYFGFTRAQRSAAVTCHTEIKQFLQSENREGQGAPRMCGVFSGSQPRGLRDSGRRASQSGDPGGKGEISLLGAIPTHQLTYTTSET